MCTSWLSLIKFNSKFRKPILFNSSILAYLLLLYILGFITIILAFTLFSITSFCMLVLNFATIVGINIFKLHEIIIFKLKHSFIIIHCSVSFQNI